MIEKRQILLHNVIFMEVSMPQKTNTVKVCSKKSKKNQTFSSEEMSQYLISTVKEVIEISRTPVAVLDKNGTPTGAVEYQSATVLKACELMAKLMGAIKETENKGVAVQIVSYREESETNDPDGNKSS